MRPRVSGYISSVNFTEGSEVKKGDVLFVIDPRPYEAERDKARAQLAQARSQLVLAKSERDRATSLLAPARHLAGGVRHPHSRSRAGKANVEAAQAALDAAALNLSFTRVTAPISGRISRAMVTGGNFVTTGQTLLTTLVSLDPIYVSFDGDEQVYLKYTTLARQGTRPSSRDARNPVWVGLADENGYPHQGVHGVRGQRTRPGHRHHPRPCAARQPRAAIYPGLFARVKLHGRRGSTTRSSSTTVRSARTRACGTCWWWARATRSSTGRCSSGPIIDGLRVVQSGLVSGETVVVNGLQRVRAGAQVHAAARRHGRTGSRGCSRLAGRQHQCGARRRNALMRLSDFFIERPIFAGRHLGVHHDRRCSSRSLSCPSASIPRSCRRRWWCMPPIRARTPR